MDYLKFYQNCNNEKSCIGLFIKFYFNDYMVCIECDRSNKISAKKNSFKIFQCNNCNINFSIFKNTVFANSHVDFRKWLYIFHITMTSSKHITSLSVSKKINVSYKTAYRMLTKVRKTLREKNFKLISVILEINDNIITGKLTN